MRIKFIKVQGGWYADLPDYLESGGTFEDCQMVSGADIMLERLAKGEDEVNVWFSEKEPMWYDVVMTKKFNPDVVSGSDYYYHLISQDHYLPNMDGNIWLCDVTKFAFHGRFPETIYLKVIPNGTSI